ncbi:hypothetical protein D6C76_01340 [Aureobasidium pullulans]|nr:hypothetical protein D6C76_01340 [Aureobasidium pullulans]
MLQRHPQEFYEPLFLLTRYSIPVTPRTKEFLSQQLLSKMAITSANVPDWQYAINGWQFCHLRDASISQADLFVHTRELIPEDVKFFNSTVNASTAIVRVYICLRLLAYFRKRKIL